MVTGPMVYVVDDDEAVRDSVRWLLESADMPVRCLPDATSFLETFQHEHPSCLILDVRLPDMSGLELQRVLANQGIEIPVIIITGHGDIPMAVEAMKAGACDFLEKPFSDEALLNQVHGALSDDDRSYRNQESIQEIAARFSLLSPREREVMFMVVDGAVSKQIAQRLGITVKTVEVHRSRIMEKTQANGIAHLVRMYMQWSAATPHTG